MSKTLVDPKWGVAAGLIASALTLIPSLALATPSLADVKAAIASDAATAAALTAATQYGSSLQSYTTS